MNNLVLYVAMTNDSIVRDPLAGDAPMIYSTYRKLDYFVKRLQRTNPSMFDDIRLVKLVEEKEEKETVKRDENKPKKRGPKPKKSIQMNRVESVDDILNKADSVSEV